MKKILFTFLLSILSFNMYAQLPSMVLKDVQGKSISTDTISNDGKPFVISFFASWCKPCNRELDNIAEVYEEWQEETNVKLFAVSIDEGQNSQKVKPFVDSHGWAYTILLDPNSDFRRAMGISMIPHTLIFDGNGKLVSSRSGYQDGSEEHIIETVKELIEKDNEY